MTDAPLPKRIHELEGVLSPSPRGGGFIPREGGMRRRVHKTYYRVSNGVFLDPPLMHEVFESDAFWSLSLGARAAYIGLYVRMWHLKDPGVIPDESRVMARLAGVPMRIWEGVRDELEPFFDLELREGCWVHRKVMTEDKHARLYARRLSTIRSKARLQDLHPNQRRSLPRRQPKGPSA
jgi:uncharacterized protein YdaU (DUF1376 family)